MSLAAAREHSEHIAHAAHGHGGHEDSSHGGKSFGTLVGITMAALGVLLAICSAKVGAERTELVQTLVEQQNAHAKYQAQDVKHRAAYLNLSSIHAAIFAPTTPVTPNKADVAAMAKTVQRYLTESHLAKEWTEAYDGAVQAHIEAQEHYEFGQLFAEMGIVIASIALLTSRKSAWLAAIALGVVAIGFVVNTWIHTRAAVHAAEAKIATTNKTYRDVRSANKTTAAEEELVNATLKWAEEPSTKG